MVEIDDLLATSSNEHKEDNVLDKISKKCYLPRHGKPSVVDRKFSNSEELSILSNETFLIGSFWTGSGTSTYRNAPSLSLRLDITSREY